MIMSSRAQKPVIADPCPTPDAAILDLGHLRRYTMDSIDLERELIGLFLGQLPALLEQLQKAVEPPEWKLATHTLKGSARVIGANRIGEVAAELELLGQSGDVESMRRLMATLDQAVADFNRLAAELHP